MNAKAELTAVPAHLLPKIALPAEVQMIRDELGLTQKQLAERMGVTEFSVWRWESGKREITESHTILLRGMLARSNGL